MTDLLLPAHAVPDGGAVLNPFVIVDDAAGLIEFVTDVFGVSEDVEARTPMPDGKLIHAQVRLGTVDLMFADRLDGWPARRGLLQVWVNDITTVLERGTTRGATIVTEPTPFYGETSLGRMLDPWQNLWWLWSLAPGHPDADDNSDVVFSTPDTVLRSMAQEQHR